MPPTIYVVGSANIDLNIRSFRLPRTGETLIGHGFDRALGGKGANQAVAAARLGGQVVLIAAVGNDAFGKECLQAYSAEGIATQYIHIIPEVSTGIAIITVADDGSNTIVLAPGANAALKASCLIPLEQQIQPGDILLLQLEIPSETVIQAIRIGVKCGARVILDPAPAPKEVLPDDVFSLLFALLPNEHEAQALCPASPTLDEMAKSLYAKGVANVLLTRGADGVIWASNRGIQYFPACAVQAIDTVAAGDVYAGAFAVALAEGMSIDEAIHFGQCAASLSVQKAGAQPSMPYRRDVDSLFQPR